MGKRPGTSSTVCRPRSAETTCDTTRLCSSIRVIRRIVDAICSGQCLVPVLSATSYECTCLRYVSHRCNLHWPHADKTLLGTAFADLICTYIALEHNAYMWTAYILGICRNKNVTLLYTSDPRYRSTEQNYSINCRK